MKNHFILAALLATALSSSKRVAARASAADTVALTPQGGVSIALPQRTELAPSPAPNLLTDGGFENVTLDASTEPVAWRTFSHTYTADKALGK